MQDDRGFSFSVAEAKALVALQEQWRREQAEREWIEREMRRIKHRD